MSGRCRCGAQNCDGSCGEAFTIPEDVTCNLVKELTPTVDAVRDIHTQLGTRGYIVKVVRTVWSGGERGVGVEQVMWEKHILPTPLISDVKAVRQELLSIGTQEMGEVQVSEISPRYTEDDLMGRESDGSPVPKDQVVYWEIQDDIGNPNGSTRRRFTPIAAPFRDPTQFEWSIQLVRARGDRTRAGYPT